MIGRAMASNTSLGTGVGPGAISWYFFITRLLPRFECASVRLAEARRPRQCGGIISGMSSLTVRTMCPMNCHPTFCGMLVEVSDQGRLLGVRGDPDNPDSQGFLCIRGRAAVELPHNERRILTPLLREGRRGEDRWRGISWKEAIDRISSAIESTRRERVGFWFGHGAHVTGINRPLIMRFGHLGGMQVWNPAIVCWAMGAYGLALTGVIETNTKEDMAKHSRLVILWGANLASQPTTSPHLVEARRRGARVVAIDVRRAEASRHADETLLIRPGTDAALALAMAHVIVAEGFVGGGGDGAGRRGHPAPRPRIRERAALDDRGGRRQHVQASPRLGAGTRGGHAARAHRPARSRRRRPRPAPPSLPDGRSPRGSHRGHGHAQFLLGCRLDRARSREGRAHRRL